MINSAHIKNVMAEEEEGMGTERPAYNPDLKSFLKIN